MKKRTTAYLKNKVLWPLFSKYIRLKYAKDGMVRCVTCGVVKPIKEMQAGHFIPGRHNSVLFQERNCHPQCAKCNIFLHGNLVEYYAFMLKTYGQGTIDELKMLDKIICQYKRHEIEEMIETYKNKLTALELMQGEE